MRERVVRALCAAPVLAAALGAGRLIYDAAVPRAAIVEVEARCDTAGCAFRVPERRGVVGAVRIASPSKEPAAWQLCVRGSCAPVAAAPWFGAVELRVGRALPGEEARLLGPSRLGGVERVRLLYQWPGWRATIGRAWLWTEALLGASPSE
jgi:hypothetical protein